MDKYKKFKNTLYYLEDYMLHYFEKMGIEYKKSENYYDKNVEDYELFDVGMPIKIEEEYGGGLNFYVKAVDSDGKLTRKLVIKTGTFHSYHTPEETMTFMGEINQTDITYKPEYNTLTLWQRKLQDNTTERRIEIQVGKNQFGACTINIQDGSINKDYILGTNAKKLLYIDIVDRIIADLIMAENMLRESEIQWIKTLLNDSRIKNHVIRILNNLPDTDEEQYNAQYEKLVQEHQEEIAKVTREFSRKLSELLKQYQENMGINTPKEDDDEHHKRVLIQDRRKNQF